MVADFLELLAVVEVMAVTQVQLGNTGPFASYGGYPSDGQVSALYLPGDSRQAYPAQETFT